MFLTIDQLKEYKPKGELFALAGYPVHHSISPKIQEYMFKKAGFNAEYVGVEVPPERLFEFVEIARKKLSGFNCTIPHKQAITQYLSGMDSLSQSYGAVNTVKIHDGKLYGYNTDGQGFETALLLSEETLCGKRILILGNGGAARVAAFCGVKNKSYVTIAGRDIKKAKELAEEIQGDTGCKVEFDTISELSGSWDILVNTTPVGMYPESDKSPVKLEKIKGLSCVYDLIYNPPKTMLLKEAAARRIKTINGTEMLAFQAVFAFEIWSGQSFDNNFKQNVAEYAKTALFLDRLERKWEKSSIALTGFMGSGKTTVGKILADKLNMDFVDIDELIEKREGKKVSDIFNHHGEEYFRELEYKAVCEASKRKNCVLSTGGGAVTFERNVNALKKNCVIIFLNAPLEKIKENLKESDTVRPLLSPHNRAVHDTISELYLKRLPIYLLCADITADASGNPMECYEDVIISI